MAQAPAVRGWDFEVDRGPDWLFVRPRISGNTESDPSLFAEQVWSLMEQHFATRVVLEMGEIGWLNSPLIGQLVGLQKRISTQDGVLRLCELSPGNEEALHTCRLKNHLRTFHDREEAVLGPAWSRMPR